MQSPALLAYYFLCCGIAFFTYKDVQASKLKWPAAIMVATFALLVVGYAFWPTAGLIAYGCAYSALPSSRS